MGFWLMLVGNNWKLWKMETEMKIVQWWLD